VTASPGAEGRKSSLGDPAHRSPEAGQERRWRLFGNPGSRGSLWHVPPAVRNAQNWRLASGLVLFTFAATHFLNHSLGLVSVQWMEAVQVVRRGFWRSWPGTTLLYGALAVHVSLVLLKLVRRRTWRMTPWEYLQIGLGLLIPFLGAAHVAATRGVSAVTGYDDRYRNVLRLLWPDAAASQSLFLLVVWMHGSIGLHYWLRTKRWYGRWSPFLLVAAVLVPALAVTGWIEAARRLRLLDLAYPPMTDAMRAVASRLIDRAELLVWAVFAVALGAAFAFRIWMAVRAGPRITYPNGRTVRGVAGSTLLEISRSAGVPHAAICGGRGRCTTCRVMVLRGLDSLAPAGGIEAAALSRIAAPPGVRLACQIRPANDLSVRPLVPSRDSSTALGEDRYRWGVERRVTVLFADIRGFTTLAERLYPYDAVFLLNRFFEVMSEAVERQGGEVDKFLGDGIMALFGLTPAPGAGSRAALLAARDMLSGLDRLNVEFEATVPDGLRMGIGIHMGPVVLGRVGGGGRFGLTALGDTVNIASRLEALNKEFGSAVVASSVTVQAGRMIIANGEARSVPVRGRAERLDVVAAADLSALTEAPAGKAIA
jgi:adenylate cyclase